MAKNNRELPGFERPTIGQIDEAVVIYLQRKKEHTDATGDIKAARAVLDAAMREHDEALQENSTGDPVYVYHDGEDEFAVVLCSSEKLKVELLTAANDPAAAIG